jgi:ketosteroid isomerase-like protein
VDDVQVTEVSDIERLCREAGDRLWWALLAGARDIGCRSRITRFARTRGTDERSTRVDLEQAVERYHAAAGEFAKGNPEPVKAAFSRRDDVTLANPFGPAVRGWKLVSDALDYASSRFSDGEVTGFESVARYVATDLASMLEIERWKAKVGDREDVSPFDLRVTSTFRREDDAWKLVHRHADPITTTHPDGPLRGSSG